MSTSVKNRLLLAALLFLPLAGSGQEMFRGIVADSASFAPLPYVNIQVKNKSAGTTSDRRGNFSILAGRSDTLVFSLVGYERLELPLFDYEAGIVRMAERATLLKTITIDDRRPEDAYRGLFDEQNAARARQSIPFYYSRARKDKLKAGFWRQEQLHVQTYVNVVINNPDTRKDLMTTYSLSEEEYYKILSRFNERYHSIMYNLTEAELISFLNRFFEGEAGK